MAFTCAMIDLETLGNSPGCVILSLGVVEFDPDSMKTGRELYLVINKQSCLDKGLKTNPDTIEWWSKQAEDAKDVLKKAESDSVGEINVSLESALIALKVFLEPCGGSVKVFSCGSDFDLPILVTAYEACGMSAPWKFWNSRCFRTWKALAMWVKGPNVGVAHNALADAKNQTAHLFAIAQALRLKIK